MTYVTPAPGRILADVPPEGIEMPDDQAADWVRHGLVRVRHLPTRPEVARPRDPRPSRTVRRSRR